MVTRRRQSARDFEEDGLFVLCLSNIDDIVVLFFVCFVSNAVHVVEADFAVHRPRAI